MVSRRTASELQFTCYSSVLPTVKSRSWACYVQVPALSQPVGNSGPSSHSKTLPPECPVLSSGGLWSGHWKKAEAEAAKELKGIQESEPST